MTLSPYFASILGSLGVIGIVLIILAVVLVFMAIGMYNKLVKSRNLYRNAFSQIDVQLKRRHDLIPNLIETAKKFMSHEKETLEAVISARSAASSARSDAAANPGDERSMGKLATAEQGLGGALGRLFALREDYPDLKSNENMMQLSEELTTTENKIAFSRQAYNDSVMKYNNARETFPTNFFASTFNFGPASSFEIADESEKEPVKVDFD